MSNNSESYLLSQEFSRALLREGLLLEKAALYRDLLNGRKIKNTVLIDLMNTLFNEAQTHIHILKDKMVKLNIRG